MSRVGVLSRVHVMKQFSYQKNNSLCTFDYSCLTLNYVPMSSNHYFLSCNYVCLSFNYCFVIQWLDNDVFLLRRSIIACWHSIIQYRFPSIICVYPQNGVRLFERRDDGQTSGPWKRKTRKRRKLSTRLNIIEWATTYPILKSVLGKLLLMSGHYKKIWIAVHFLYR